MVEAVLKERQRTLTGDTHPERGYFFRSDHFPLAKAGVPALSLTEPEQFTGPNAAALKAMHPNKYNQKRFCLERFIDALVEAGVADRPKPKEKKPTRLDRLQAEYESYLRDQRGLTDATIYHCVSFRKRFMGFRFGRAGHSGRSG